MSATPTKLPAHGAYQQLSNHLARKLMMPNLSQIPSSPVITFQRKRKKRISQKINLMKNSQEISLRIKSHKLSNRLRKNHNQNGYKELKKEDNTEITKDHIIEIRLWVIGSTL